MAHRRARRKRWRLGGGGGFFAAVVLAEGAGEVVGDFDVRVGADLVISAGVAEL